MKITITDSAYEDLIDIKEHYILEGVEHTGRDHERFLSKFRRFDLQIEL